MVMKPKERKTRMVAEKIRLVKRLRDEQHLTWYQISKQVRKSITSCQNAYKSKAIK